MEGPGTKSTSAILPLAISSPRLSPKEAEWAVNSEVAPSMVSHDTNNLFTFNGFVTKFVGGKVAWPDHVKQWEKLTSDPEILQIIKGDIIKFISEPPAKHQARPCLVSHDNEKLIDREVEDMLNNGIIRMSWAGS